MPASQTEKVIIGAALTAAAYALFPAVQATFRSLVSETTASGGIARSARAFAAVVREEVEDIVAEARFEQWKKRLDREIAMDRDEATAAGEKGPGDATGSA